VEENECTCHQSTKHGVFTPQNILYLAMFSPSENSHQNHDRYDKSRNSKQDDYKK
jgi:hypothetical protein